MKHDYGTVLLIMLLSAAASGFAFIRLDCGPDPEHVPNPEARKVYERLGAPFKPVNGLQPSVPQMSRAAVPSAVYRRAVFAVRSSHAHAPAGTAPP
jgi:hypothetical protein